MIIRTIKDDPGGMDAQSGGVGGRPGSISVGNRAYLQRTILPSPPSNCSKSNAGGETGRDGSVSGRFHHRDDRIRSHMQLCWLGLLLMRVIETGPMTPGANEVNRMRLVTMETAEGRVAQRSATTACQAEILRGPRHRRALTLPRFRAFSVARVVPGQQTA